MIQSLAGLSIDSSRLTPQCGHESEKPRCGVIGLSVNCRRLLRHRGHLVCQAIAYRAVSIVTYASKIQATPNDLILLGERKNNVISKRTQPKLMIRRRRTRRWMYSLIVIALTPERYGARTPTR